MHSIPAYRVTAYITAYCDPAALTDCLEAITAQSYPIRQILIVDNSPAALTLQPEHQADSRILVWPHPKNIGIAGGLALAVAHCIAQGDDFLWTFDQDSIADRDCLQQLLVLYEQAQADPSRGPVGTVSPSVVDRRNGEVVRPSRWMGDRFKGFLPTNPSQPYECDAPITSGCLVAIAAAQQVPVPDPRLLIDGLDLDYGLRIQRAGFHNWIAPQAQLFHNFGVPQTIRLLGIPRTLLIYSPLRRYYICRNHTYLELFHAQGLAKITCILRRLKYLLTCIFYISIYDASDKWLKIKACIIGTYYGLRGNLDIPW